MELIIKKDVLVANIEKAKRLCKGKEVAVMVKSFYSYISKLIPDGVTIYGCGDYQIHYIVGTSSYGAQGMFCTSIEEVREAMRNMDYGKIAIPVNAGDNREGLSIENAKEVVSYCKKEHIDHYALVTSGCLKDYSPSSVDIDDIGKELGCRISVGGSYYLSKPYLLLSNVFEVRIGEYALFGTIPFCEPNERFGECAIFVESKILRAYPERRQVIIDCGYSTIDVKDSVMLSGGLTYIDSSSEYTIFEDKFGIYREGDVIRFIPNYKSLIKLKDVERRIV